MGELLQSCLTTEEAYMVIQRYLHKLFPSQAGALYLTSASRNLVEAKVVWGSSGTLAGELLFTPSECWALRRGRPHVVEDAQIGLPCRHAGPTYTGSYLCAPMMAQGEALGILHVQYTGQDGDTNASLLDTTQRLAVTVADQVGLALANLALRETLRNQSIRDPLTGLFNRRYLEEALDREVLRATRSQGSIGIIMLDIDHFKHFNDTFGHAAGDTLLREMGTMLKSFIRGGDIACRYGGEEFILVLPEATRDVARARAEELREKIRHLDVEYRGQALANITLSLGIAAFPDHGQDQDTLLRLADNALYHAKREGRNRVVVA
jgi:diguanylate cyclase (GGDEF)-like protein